MFFLPQLLTSRITGRSQSETRSRLGNMIQTVATQSIILINSGTRFLLSWFRTIYEDNLVKYRTFTTHYHF